MTSPKIRLDQFCARRGLSASREKARREIIAGWVQVGGETVRDPSKKIPENAVVTVKRPGGLFVSRGGEKLERALEVFAIDVKGKTVADLGASTGGFTDCLLKRGAKKIYAVDVGYGQLDYSLQRDERVVVMDRTNARLLEKEMFPDKVDFVTGDMSFVSILKVIETMKKVFSPFHGVFLIKPQFEAAPGEHKKGVVRKKEVHEAILCRVLTGFLDAGMDLLSLTWSPVKGPAGNIEFLLHGSFMRDLSDDSMLREDIESLVHRVVEEAHAKLPVNPVQESQ